MKDRRTTYAAAALARCEVCRWRCRTSNAVGLAAQHHDRTGHAVSWERRVRGKYG